jgi:hypothetical protein
LIGRLPIFAFGNSDGDHRMLQGTAVGSGRRFIGLIHRTDARREWAYDRRSRIGRLEGEGRIVAPRDGMRPVEQ